MATAPPVESVYVHVPFCARKCTYCAFFSEATDGPVMERFVQALIRELEQQAVGLRPRTIFFGGGTPSLLNLAQWRAILDAMRRLDLLGAEEWTIECNPATVSLDKALLWRDFGVNRVSMGVQSLDESLLERLGRIHSRGMVFSSFDRLRKAGFDNLNLDLMFGIPGQTLEVWEATLREAIDLGSEHVSSYEVIYEEDTPLFEELKARKFSVDEDLLCAMFDALLEQTESAGLIQYEVANFARHNGPLKPHNGPPAFACRHNINYWQGGSYLALGPSASGYVHGVRTTNVANTSLYCDRLEAGESPLEWKDPLPPLARAGEIAAFGLRMNTGWSFDRFHNVTGFDLRQHWQPAIDQLCQQGWGVQTADRFRLSSQGLRFADAAGQLFLIDAP